jgi:predicted metal-binding membrane protein
MWAVMMVGMMLPSATPTILLFAALERKRPAAATARTAFFVAGYFAIWTVFSVAAAAAQTALSHAGLVSMQMAVTTALLAGSIFILAGIYEFTPLKERCLVHCRSPLEWIPRHMRPGRMGAFRMGMEHGAYCVGCCWVLMLVLFAVGVMNLVWVAAIAAAVLTEKLLPAGRLFSRIVGTALVAWGVFLIGDPLWRN